jgi:hypothetical protein
LPPGMERLRVCSVSMGFSKLCVLLYLIQFFGADATIPIVVNTWGMGNFRNATAAAWDVIAGNAAGTAALDAVEKVCTQKKYTLPLAYG